MGCSEHGAGGNPPFCARGRTFCFRSPLGVTVAEKPPKAPVIATISKLLPGMFLRFIGKAAALRLEIG